MKNKKTFQNSMEGEKVTMLDCILREDVLQSIIFELREVLKYYADEDIYNWKSNYEYANDMGEKAREILKKYNKSWDELYKEMEERMKEFEKNQNNK